MPRFLLRNASDGRLGYFDGVGCDWILYVPLGTPGSERFMLQAEREYGSMPCGQTAVIWSRPPPAVALSLARRSEVEWVDWRGRVGMWLKSPRGPVAIVLSGDREPVIQVAIPTWDACREMDKASQVIHAALDAKKR